MAGSAAAFSELAELLDDAPLVLVDVGARGGIPKRWRSVDPWLHTIGFEPDSRSLEALDHSERRTTLPTALASRRGSVTLHLTAGEGETSLLTPNRRFFRRFRRANRFDVVGTRTVEADTLDNQLAAHGVDTVDFIKLDTQGSELMVLEGARETLRRRVFGLEVEVELNPVYEQQPLLSDVDSFLRPLGYELFDLKLHRWKYRAGGGLVVARGQVVYADAVFFLGPDHALPPLTRDGEVRAESVAHIVVTCLLYNLGDYALALLDALGSEISPSLRDRLTRTVGAYDTAARNAA